MKEINDIKLNFKPVFDPFRELGIYCWIAGGSIRDFLLEEEHKDIDLCFTNNLDHKRAASMFTGMGFHILKHYSNHYSVRRGDELYDLMASWKSPTDCINNFDYTMCSAALDSNLEFYHHPKFFDDLRTKKLTRLPQSDRWALTNVTRLRKFLNQGFSMDTKNLIQFLSDQEETLKYRKKMWRTPELLEKNILDKKKKFSEIFWQPTTHAAFSKIKAALLSLGDSPRILEIGSFEGYSACWFLETIPNSTIDCVDPFSSTYIAGDKVFENYEIRFDENTSDYKNRIKKIKNTSYAFFKNNLHLKESYDIIFIDGNHEGDCVLEDAVNAYRFLKKGGVLIFDDYLCTPFNPPSKRPQIAIDAFLSCYEEKLDLLIKREICAVKKIK